MSPLFYLINTLLTLALYLIILRIWMQYAQVNYYNPFTQFIVKITQPIIGPLRKMIPAIGKIDTASFILLYLAAIIKFMVLTSFTTNASYFDLRYLLYALLVIVNSAGHLIFWILLARSILSWISQGQSPIEEILYHLSEPLIAPIRRFVPPIGNIDISFMIFVFALILLNMIFMSLFSPWWAFISLY